jgi:hypothetical protein
MLCVRRETAESCDEFLTRVKVRRREGHSVAPVNAASFPMPTWSPEEPLFAGRIVAVLAAAHRLRAGSKAAGSSKALRGKNLALLSSVSPGYEISPLHRAAEDLGARVAEVRFEPNGSGQPDVGTLARLLGRMYDAIDCDSLPPMIVRRIEKEAGVPVYGGLGQDTHPARAIADLMTLCEQGPPSGTHKTLLFVGNPRTPRSSVLLSAASELGIALRVAGGVEATLEGVAFVVNATRAPDWSLHVQGRPVDEGLRSENHRCVIQTVLLDTIHRT